MDYKNIDLKIGLEIHQRLETHKLFCYCPSVLRDDHPDIIIKRRLRSVAGETGDVDIAAKYEEGKNLEFIYEAYKDTTCLVELDEEPPLPMNKEALDIVLQIAKLLKAEVVDEIQVMRKTVIDGSNTAGFQRTALVARNGFVNTSKGKVRIGSICIEEEAAKNIKEEQHSRRWRLDRLGIPLVEVQTLPDIRNPLHAKETAEIIGMILRSTGKVKHGIGSIRQDINLSIKNGNRIEIKGFQDLRNIPKVIDYEIKRQLNLLGHNKEIQKEVRKANADNTTSFMRPMPGSARMYPETDIFPVYISPKYLSSIIIPELITEKVMKLEKKYNLVPDLAREILTNEIEFDLLVSKFKKISPSFIAHALIEYPKEIKTRFDLDSSKLKDKDFEFVFSSLNKNLIPKSAVFEILTEIAKGNKIELNNYRLVSDKEMISHIKKVISKNKGAPLNALMGEVMKSYRGKVDGKKVLQIIQKSLK